MRSLSFVFSILVLSGCSPHENETGAPAHLPETGAPRIRIVASIAPLASLAARIAGPSAEIITLVPPGASEHTWEPAPRDVERLSRAQVFFKVGLEFEAWASKLLDANAVGYEVVDASRAVDLIDETEEGSAHRSSLPAALHARSPDDPGAVHANPHYWLDPLSLEDGVTHLAEVLAGLDPKNAGDYRARGLETISALRSLDEDIRRRTSRFTSKRLLTSHEAWDYFARRYGLEIVGAIEEFPGKEPGPRHVVDVVRLARSDRIRAVFAEPQYPTKAAEVIASECQVPVLLLDPLGGAGVAGRSDYFSLMRYNLDIMGSALE